MQTRSMREERWGWKRVGTAWGNHGVQVSYSYRSDGCTGAGAGPGMGSVALDDARAKTGVDACVATIGVTEGVTKETELRDGTGDAGT